MNEPVLIEHAVVDILIIKDNKFLLVEESKPGREGLFNLPGGRVEAHETLFAAAIREAKEESGYDVELTGLVGVYQGVTPLYNVSGPVFSARIIGGEATPTPAHPSIRWVTKDELDGMAKAGELFTKYPPIAIAHYETRGILPLDTISCTVYP
ncbi:NUDIX hydrolase [Candidatus Saccharibacteria bacterium]|nr:NUDIX hydrolase [Candidatus Saccharibacteria bacterium]